MRILGVSEGSHDAAWAVVEDGVILEAHHVERHTREKNDKWIPGKLLPGYDLIIGHENKDRVNDRRAAAGQRYYSPIIMKRMHGLDGQQRLSKIVIFFVLMLLVKTKQLQYLK